MHPLHAPLAAEVAYACRHEFAETAVDVLAYRTRLSFLDASASLEALPRVLEIMKQEKGWDQAQVALEEERAMGFLAKAMAPPPALAESEGAGSEQLVAA